MNREQEAELTKMQKAGQLSPDFYFEVERLETGNKSIVPGDVISGFLDKKTYHITPMKKDTKKEEKVNDEKIG